MLPIGFALLGLPNDLGVLPRGLSVSDGLVGSNAVLGGMASVATIVWENSSTPSSFLVASRHFEQPKTQRVSC
jgi:hypothetical protein